MQSAAAVVRIRTASHFLRRALKIATAAFARRLFRTEEVAGDSRDYLTFHDPFCCI